MTFDTTSMRATGIGDGVATTFPFGFLVTLATDLEVFTIVDATGVRSNKVLTTDYSVTGLNQGTGGNVVMVVAPPVGETLYIQRRPPVTQKTDIKNQGEYFGLTHEKTFDKSRMVDQRIQDDAERSLRMPQEEAPDPNLTVIPRLSVRKGRVLGFDAAGKPVSKSAGNAPAELLWMVRGALSTADNPFPKYRAVAGIAFLNYDIYAITPGVGGDTVVDIQKNGGTLATITLPAGANQAKAAPVSIPMVDGDIISPLVVSVAPTTPPSDITIAVRA